jgi:hypothetical protein
MPFCAGFATIGVAKLGIDFPSISDIMSSTCANLASFGGGVIIGVVTLSVGVLALIVWRPESSNG